MIWTILKFICMGGILLIYIAMIVAVVETAVVSAYRRCLKEREDFLKRLGTEIEAKRKSGLGYN